MSLKKKLAIIFSSVVTIVLVINNTLFYFYTQDLLQQDQVKQMELLAKEISISIEHSQYGANYVEDLIGEKLRVAGLAAQYALDPDIEKVSDEELVALSEKLGVSYITLMVQEQDDIRGVKSSDPKERDLSTKEWGYWYTAFQQLFEHKQVTIPEGQKLKNYWAGPMNVSASDPNHVDKWGYYYDGTTNYIISPYMRDKQIMDFKDQIGPVAVIQKTLSSNPVLLSITGFNPRTFGHPPVYTEQNGQKFVELANQEIQFGDYKFQQEELDVPAVRMAMESGNVVSFLAEWSGQAVLKSFIPILAETPYVIGIVTDYKVVQEVLDKQLLNSLIISVIVLVFVFCISYLLADYIVRPLNRILQKVNEIAEGNIGSQVKIDRRDELGLLSNGVNKMSTNLLNYTNEIQYQANHDYLTGLPNLRLFNQITSEKAAEANQSSFAILFLDLDKFKFVNDMLGHAAGDHILKAAAERVTSLLQDGETLARIGGDEFLLLLPNSQRERAKETAERIKKEFEKPFVYGGNEFFITVSIGISLYPTDSTDVEAIVNNADMAMYRAKERGRNNYQFYCSDMNEAIQRRALLEKGMRRALERGEFILHYQPQVDIQTGILTGNEALIRWHHPDLGMISPMEFIPLAEETGLISMMGEWIIRTACKQNKQWQENGFPPMRISVNLSVHQFQQINLVDQVKEALEATGLDPQYLELEITESIAMYNEEYVISKLQALKNLGVKIAIDDFGTGYSSLSYLRKFPIDCLKIDKSFVRDIGDESDAMIISTIMAMARQLKVNVIAEGVETEEQLDLLRELQCNEAQGYLFSKPLSVEDFNRLFQGIQEAAMTKISKV
ncbi:EAL domain-containing protein [Ammoniphilus sp. YIM 78166]|uniref:bifunctional diguanylate cyclase/phosphodiesterase n=1 Tax=Ammoniphilus sp. YIM 78166 TaxID=1644106 RepID=UPI00106F55E2|nr:EAL domain-containing protein [Ammoniphilus sp. YIM 78166]